MVMNKKKGYWLVSILDGSKTAFMKKGNFSGHVKSYHDTIKNKKYFAFSYGEGIWLPIEYMSGKREIVWPK